jgi:hypothetical protein
MAKSLPGFIAGVCQVLPRRPRSQHLRQHPLDLRQVRSPLYRRPIYGTVRYASLKSGSKKFDTAAYVVRYSNSKVKVKSEG